MSLFHGKSFSKSSPSNSTIQCVMSYAVLGKSQSNPEIDWMLLEMDHC